MGCLLAAGAAGGAALEESQRSAAAALAAVREAQGAGFSALMASSYGGIAASSGRSALTEDDPAERARETAMQKNAQANADRLVAQTERRSRAQDGRLDARRAHAAASTWLAALAASLLAAAAWLAAAGWRRTPAGLAALTVAAVAVAWAAWPLLASLPR